jgi:hypothetical protein
VSNLDERLFLLLRGSPEKRAKNARRHHRFETSASQACVDEMATVHRAVRVVNPTARIILPVSPVALVATYDDRHVLVSTTACKAALRTVAMRSRPASTTSPISPPTSS